MPQDRFHDLSNDAFPTMIGEGFLIIIIIIIIIVIHPPHPEESYKTIGSSLTSLRKILTGILTNQPQQMTAGGESLKSVGDLFLKKAKQQWE